MIVTNLADGIIKAKTSVTTTAVTNPTIKTPPYFYRDFKKDLPLSPNDSTSVNQLKRIGQVTLPFLCLYKPFGQVISIGMESLSCFGSLASLKENAATGRPKWLDCLKVAAKVSTFALMILTPTVGMLVTTTRDMLSEGAEIARSIKAGDFKQTARSCASLIQSSLYLSLFFTGSLEIMLLSCSVQILGGMGHAIEEFAEGNFLEGTGHLLMSAIKTNQLVPKITELSIKRKITSPSIVKAAQVEGAVSTTVTTASKLEIQSTSTHFSEGLTDEALLNKAQTDNNLELAEIIKKYKNKTPYFEPALLNAIFLKDYSAAQTLIKSNAKINYEIPILACAFTNRDVPYEFVEELIKNGAKVNWEHNFVWKGVEGGEWWEKIPSLAMAGRQDRPDLVKLLIDSRADIHAEFSVGNEIYTALSYLTSHCVMVTDWGPHPFFVHRYAKKLPITVKCLFEAGANPNQRDAFFRFLSTYNAGMHNEHSSIQQPILYQFLLIPN